MPALGYPEVEISVGPDGVTAPSTLAAGTYLIRFSSAPGYSGYLNFMQPPAGLSDEETTELALAAARDDLAQEGWVYAGGNNTFEEGVPALFVIDLAPGEYRIAASYYGFEEDSEEIMTPVPLTVTAAGTPGASPAASRVASPVASPIAGTEPPATVTLEMTDELRYIITPDPGPTGPPVWKVTNSGVTMAHHVVMVRIPESVTADQIVSEFSSLMAQFTFVGYAALQSGGQTTWVEFDLDPGAYAVICYIIDPMTGRPHLTQGMVNVFTVA